ncbi:phosphoribosylformylglycinamidine synthase subunit I [Bartonella apihabitans]|uniref:Phosphoribosylformylglycinamidine synthase subunit I n=1 Tax=Bartonella apihabitans TaxID=2750929 RepID=A0A1U9MBT2_9HYPH|nr:phosphoribosylformylglycinamidine synthase subunit I [Bartonella apihabitans]
MKTAVIQLPGLNRDRDMIDALRLITGVEPLKIWQTETTIPDVDLIVIPGGFSYGDYLRCGAIAARMPVMKAVFEHAEKGTKIIGVCNGFQILVEAGLLPGALMRNASLRFACREVKLQIVNEKTVFSNAYHKGEIIRCPVAHHDGNYYADKDTIEQLEGTDRSYFAMPRGQIRMDQSMILLASSTKRVISWV